MRCPDCHCDEAVYQSMSGGQEGYCPKCNDTFSLSRLPVDERPLAVLLQTEAGQTALRARMDQRLARLRDQL
jgi:hypothetical protein